MLLYLYFTTTVFENQNIFIVIVTNTIKSSAVPAALKRTKINISKNKYDFEGCNPKCPASNEKSEVQKAHVFETLHL